MITNVEELKQNGGVKLSIHATDGQIAETKLMKLLNAEDDVILTEFKKKEYELEDAFMDIIGRSGEHVG